MPSFSPNGAVVVPAEASSPTNMRSLADAAKRYSATGAAESLDALIKRLTDLADERPQVRRAVSLLALLVRADAGPKYADVLNGIRGDDPVTDVDSVAADLRSLWEGDPADGELGHLLVAIHAINSRSEPLRQMDVESIIRGVSQMDPSAVARADRLAQDPSTPVRACAEALYGPSWTNRIRRTERPEWAAVTEAARDCPGVATAALAARDKLRERVRATWWVGRLPVSLLAAAGAVALIALLGGGLAVRWAAGDPAASPGVPAAASRSEPSPPAKADTAPPLPAKADEPLPPCPPGLLPGPVMVVVDDGGMPDPAREAFKAKMLRWAIGGIGPVTESAPAEAKADAKAAADAAKGGGPTRAAIDYDTLPVGQVVPAWAFAKPEVVAALFRYKLAPNQVQTVVVARTLRPGGAEAAPLAVVTVYRPGDPAPVVASASGAVPLPVDCRPVRGQVPIRPLTRRTAFPDAPTSRFVADALAAWATGRDEPAVAAALVIRSAKGGSDREAAYTHARDILRAGYTSYDLSEKAVLMLALLETDENRVTVVGRERATLDPNRAGTRAVSGNVLSEGDKVELLQTLAREILTAGKGD